MTDSHNIAIAGRLKELRTDSRLKVTEIADALGITRSAYYQIEDCKVSLTIKYLGILESKYNFNHDYIINGRLPKYINDISGAAEPIAKYSKTLQKDKENNNILAPIPANAGILIHYTQDWYNQNPVPAIIPGIIGPTVTFLISGDSMEPLVKEGDFVVCQKVHDTLTLKSGIILIVVTTQGIYLKKMVYTPDNNVALLSLNPDYEPISVHKRDIKEMYKPVKIITKFTNL